MDELLRRGPAHQAPTTTRRIAFVPASTEDAPPAPSGVDILTLGPVRKRRERARESGPGEVVRRRSRQCVGGAAPLIPSPPNFPDPQDPSSPPPMPGRGGGPPPGGRPMKRARQGGLEAETDAAAAAHADRAAAGAAAGPSVAGGGGRRGGPGHSPLTSTGGAVRELFPADGVRLTWAADRRTVSAERLGEERVDQKKKRRQRPSPAKSTSSPSSLPLTPPRALLLQKRAPACSTWATPAS